MLTPYDFFACWLPLFTEYKEYEIKSTLGHKFTANLHLYKYDKITFASGKFVFTELVLVAKSFSFFFQLTNRDNVYFAFCYARTSMKIPHLLKSANKL